MLGLPKNLKVYASTTCCDMRKQANGLLGLAETMIGRGAEIGELFLFWNRRKDLIKVVFLDATGTCVFSKRLHSGSFPLMRSGSDANVVISIDAVELSRIVAAARLSDSKRASTTH